MEKVVILSENIKEIGEMAFDGCTELSEIILPENLQEIEMDAFSKCDALDSITVNYSVEVSEAFAGIYDKNLAFIENCVKLIRTGTEEEKRKFEKNNFDSDNIGCLGVVAIMLIILGILV